MLSVGADLQPGSRTNEQTRQSSEFDPHGHDTARDTSSWQPERAE